MKMVARNCESCHFYTLHKENKGSFYICKAPISASHMAELLRSGRGAPEITEEDIESKAFDNCAAWRAIGYEKDLVFFLKSQVEGLLTVGRFLGVTQRLIHKPQSLGVATSASLYELRELMIGVRGIASLCRIHT